MNRTDKDINLNSGTELCPESEIDKPLADDFSPREHENNLGDKNPANSPAKDMVNPPPGGQDGDEWDLDNMADFIFTPEKKAKDGAGSGLTE